MPVGPRAARDRGQALFEAQDAALGDTSTETLDGLTAGATTLDRLKRPAEAAAVREQLVHLEVARRGERDAPAKAGIQGPRRSVARAAPGSPLSRG